MGLIRDFLNGSLRAACITGMVPLNVIVVPLRVLTRRMRRIASEVVYVHNKSLRSLRNGSRPSTLDSRSA